MQHGGIDLFHATPDELIMELSRRVSKRVDDILKGGADADPIRLGLTGHRARLYEIRFKATPGGLPGIQVSNHRMHQSLHKFGHGTIQPETRDTSSGKACHVLVNT